MEDLKMNKDTNKLIIKICYSDNKVDIKNELKKSILLFIEREVKKLCMQNS